jgi:hypothetical protein
MEYSEDVVNTILLQLGFCGILMVKNGDGQIICDFQKHENGKFKGRIIQMNHCSILAIIYTTEAIYDSEDLAINEVKNLRDQLLKQINKIK